jgi:hypothetical protein
MPDDVELLPFIAPADPPAPAEPPDPAAPIPPSPDDEVPDELA